MVFVCVKKIHLTEQVRFSYKNSFIGSLVMSLMFQCCNRQLLHSIFPLKFQRTLTVLFPSIQHWDASSQVALSKFIKKGHHYQGCLRYLGFKFVHQLHSLPS